MKTPRTIILNRQSKQREWDLYWLNIAHVISQKSCDTSMHVGCVIVGPDNVIKSTGYNGFCRGVEPTEERLSRPTKYDFTEHAERNAVYIAAREGVSLKGCTAYVVCDPKEKGGICPCLDCTRAFIQAGIKIIVEWRGQPCETDTGTWRDKTNISIQMLKEAGVQLRLIND